MNRSIKRLACAGLLALVSPFAALASSHMDAPLITFDDAANSTDVYAFRSASDGTEYLSTALAVYPFENPASGRTSTTSTIRSDMRSTSSPTTISPPVMHP